MKQPRYLRIQFSDKTEDPSCPPENRCQFVEGVEVSAPQVDGSRPLLVEVTVPMYNQDHQEQLVAGEQITHMPVPQMNVGVIWSAMPSAGNFDCGRCTSWPPPGKGGIQVQGSG